MHDSELAAGESSEKALGANRIPELSLVTQGHWKSATIQIPRTITVNDRMITNISIEGHQCVRFLSLALSLDRHRAMEEGGLDMNYFTKGAVVTWHSGA
jgi:hypothetical protein